MFVFIILSTELSSTSSSWLEANSIHNSFDSEQLYQDQLRVANRRWKNWTSCKVARFTWPVYIKTKATTAICTGQCPWVHAKRLNIPSNVAAAVDKALEERINSAFSQQMLSKVAKKSMPLLLHWGHGVWTAGKIHTSHQVSFKPIIPVHAH